MSVLFVDIGNSRVKWLVTELPVADPAANVERLEVNVAVDVADCLRQLETRCGAAVVKIDRCVVSCVGAAVSLQMLQDGMAKRNVPVFVHVVTTDGGGIQTAYAQPGHWGVDRWLALVGARSYCPASRLGALAVVDCGTAITVDVLSANDQHLGGLIVPGAALLQTSLQQGTARIAVSEHDEQHLLAGTTSQAVVSGAEQMTQAFVRYLQDGFAHQLAAQQGVDIHYWFITGGGAERIMVGMRDEAWQWVPNLVFAGMIALEY